MNAKNHGLNQSQINTVGPYGLSIDLMITSNIFALTKNYQYSETGINIVCYSWYIKIIKFLYLMGVKFQLYSK